MESCPGPQGPSLKPGWYRWSGSPLLHIHRAQEILVSLVGGKGQWTHLPWHLEPRGSALLGSPPCWEWDVKKSLGFKGGASRSESWPHQLFIVWTWANYLTSLNLRFIICNIPNVRDHREWWYTALQTLRDCQFTQPPLLLSIEKLPVKDLPCTSHMASPFTFNVTSFLKPSCCSPSLTPSREYSLLWWWNALSAERA